jgi:flagellar export protein FliJ
MPFHFPLQAVLHFRQSLEHQHELRFRAANQLVSRVQGLISHLDMQTQELQAHQLRILGTGTTAAEMRFALSCESAQAQRRRDLERELVRLQKLRDEQKKIFQNARLQRETLASLRSQQLHDYERETARQEQRNLDDIFLLRKAYLRRG